MRLVILAILVAVVGAGQIRIGEDATAQWNVIGYEVRQFEHTVPPIEIVFTEQPIITRTVFVTREQKKQHSKKPKPVRQQPQQRTTKRRRSGRRRTTKVYRAPPSRRSYTWVSFQGASYKVFENARNFDDADKKCKEAGAQLVSIHSEAENEFVHSITTTGEEIRKFQDFVYIGLRLDTRKKRWYWTDGSPVDYTKWAVHQPDNPDHEHCTQLHQDPGPKLIYVEDWKWNSINCGTEMKLFVCKRR